MTATPHEAPERRPWDGKLTGRWPTALAVAMTAANVAGGSPELEGMVGGFGEALLLLPLEYLIVAKLRRRGASWPVCVAAFTVMVALRALDVVSPAAVLIGITLAVLVWGAVGGELHRPGMFRVQALGAIGFAALALTGLAVDPDLGRYLVAAGWFFHGVWDFVHLKLDKVVSRSWAEWCGVVDILVAVQLLVLV
ncbi:hypothetical protein ACQEU3_38685 [Spirillospora sp. CA-253888]